MSSLKASAPASRSSAVARCRFAFLCALILGITACGIEEYIYLYPPITKNSPSTVDPSGAYFSFTTADADNTADAGGYFQGWEVYYRIYNSETDRAADVNDIVTKNTKDSANVFSYISSTKKYRRMTLLNGSATNSMLSAPLLKGTGTDRLVEIRPVSGGDEYPVEFSVDGTQLTGSDGENAYVWRSLDDVNAKSFDYPEIDSADADVTFNSSGGTDSWYLQAFALAIGYDLNYKALYSAAANLGSLKIAE